MSTPCFVGCLLEVTVRLRFVAQSQECHAGLIQTLTLFDGTVGLSQVAYFRFCDALEQAPGF